MPPTRRTRSRRTRRYGGTRKAVTRTRKITKKSKKSKRGGCWLGDMLWGEQKTNTAAPNKENIGRKVLLPYRYSKNGKKILTANNVTARTNRGLNVSV
jgi:hypothetical protein